MPRQNANNVDFSQRTAEGEDDPLNHPIIQGLRRRFPYWTLVNDPGLARQHIEGSLAAMNGRPVQDPQTDQDFSDGPTSKPVSQTEVPQALKMLQSQYPHWALWNDDVRMKRLSDLMEDASAGTQGQSQVSRLRQTSGTRGQSSHGPAFVRRGDPDHELLDSPEGWDRARGKL